MQTSYELGSTKVRLRSLATSLGVALMSPLRDEPRFSSTANEKDEKIYLIPSFFPWATF
jgi:hypothetical protein